MKWQVVETRKGTRCRVLEGGSGAPLVFFHGAGGLLGDNPFLDQIAQGYHVFAPEWPGYGESTGEDLLEDMLDFTLHGWDLVQALGLEQPHLVGHSMGGMIAAEMACLAPHDLGSWSWSAPPASGWTSTRSRISSRYFLIRSPRCCFTIPSGVRPCSPEAPISRTWRR
jgi:pimeloyl-ACP methyl ester carboxylesterase